jgi:hypothetical protein
VNKTQMKLVAEPVVRKFMAEEHPSFVELTIMVAWAEESAMEIKLGFRNPAEEHGAEVILVVKKLDHYFVIQPMEERGDFTIYPLEDPSPGNFQFYGVDGDDIVTAIRDIKTKDDGEWFCRIKDIINKKEV